MVEYYYSGYGILLNSIDNSNINLSNINPFRYRGYYQDKETLFYYLNARFYDSDAGRFITMDDISYLGASNKVCSYNLFAYCENNPIIYVEKVLGTNLSKGIPDSRVEGNDLSVYESSFSTPTGVPQFGVVIHTRSGSYYMSDHSAKIALLDLLFIGKI